MLSFNDWLKVKESSASTRNKWNAALGLQPMYSADVFGHATPAPWIADSLTVSQLRLFADLRLQLQYTI